MDDYFAIHTRHQKGNQERTWSHVQLMSAVIHSIPGDRQCIWRSGFLTWHNLKMRVEKQKENVCWNVFGLHSHYDIAASDSCSKCKKQMVERTRMTTTDKRIHHGTQSHSCVWRIAYMLYCYVPVVCGRCHAGRPKNGSPVWQPDPVTVNVKNISLQSADTHTYTNTQPHTGTFI